MRAPSFTVADIAAAFLKLLPTGEVWPRESDSVLSQVFTALAPTYQRQAARSANLLVDAFPATTVELLPEWEATLGLPDPCAGTSPTIQQRQAQVVARFAARGGQSVPYFVNFAKNLGFTVTIAQYAPFRVGANRAGQALYGQPWSHAWAVIAPLNTVTFFRTGEDAVGEPLASWGNAVLQCEIQRVAPAQSIPIFQFQ